MAKEARGYDPDLQMFVEPIHEVDKAKAGFIRWLKKNDRLTIVKEDQETEHTINLPTAVKSVKTGGLETTRYDADLQMFVNSVHEPAKEHLLFMRDLAEKGLLEHDVVGPPSGEYVAQTITQKAETA